MDEGNIVDISFEPAPQEFEIHKIIFRSYGYYLRYPDSRYTDKFNIVENKDIKSPEYEYFVSLKTNSTVNSTLTFTLNKNLLCNGMNNSGCQTYLAKKATEIRNQKIRAFSKTIYDFNE
jgi:hypothetical protein